MDVKSYPEYPMTEVLEQAAKQIRERERSTLDDAQFRIVRDRLLSDPAFMTGIVKHLNGLHRKRQRRAAEAEEASHRAALSDAYGTGGQG